MRSSDFSATTKNTIVWRLEMYPGGESQTSVNYLSLYVRLFVFNVPEIRTKIKFSILNNKGEKTNALHFPEAMKFNQGVKWDFLKFIRRDYLQSQSGTLLPNDKLTVFCEICAVYDTVNTNGFSPSIISVKSLPSTLVNDIGSMLDACKFYDCTIKVGDNNIRAHKSILSSRSLVFRAMFTSKLYESQTIIVEINDFRYEVVKEMINYIYKDSTSNLEEMGIEILAIADKYNLEGLKAMAEQSLCHTLNIGTIFEYFKISEIYGDGD